MYIWICLYLFRGRKNEIVLTNYLIINCGFERKKLEEASKFTEHDHRRDDRWKTVERAGL